MRFRELLAGVTASVVIVGCGSLAEQDSTATTETRQPSETTVPLEAPTSSAARSFTDADALSLSGDFIEAFNTGDDALLLATLTPEAALSEKYTGMSSSFSEIERAFFEQHMAWSTAQGSTFTTPDCEVTEAEDTTATVVCEFGWLDAAMMAAEKSPVPTVLTMVATPYGLSQLAFEYLPEFGSGAFDRWLYENHADDLNGVEFGDWGSVVEAEQGGKLRAQYAAEWVADREASG